MASNQIERRYIEIKSAEGAEPGTFEGLLSTYGRVDQGNDSVEPGAYTKTIHDNKGTIPILWNHDSNQPIGLAEISDSSEGLWMKGKLFIDKIPKAAEVSALINGGVTKGLSIGFKPMQKEFKDGVRLLKEIKLFEGSVVLWPMDPHAQIVSSKSMDDGAGDFTEELDEVMTARSGCIALQVLQDCLTSAWWNVGYIGWGGNGPDTPTLVNYSAAVIDQFKTQFLDSMAKYGSMMSNEEVDDGKALRLKAIAAELESKGKPKAAPAALAAPAAAIETKVGKKISGETAGTMRKALEAIATAQTNLSALLEEPAAASTEDPGAAGNKTAEPGEDPLALMWLEELKALNASFR